MIATDFLLFKREMKGDFKGIKKGASNAPTYL